MTFSSATRERATPATLDEVLEAIQRCESRNDVLRSLAEGARPLLARARIYAVQNKELRGLVHVDPNGVDTANVTSSLLPFTHATVGGRAVRDRVPYIGPLPPTDPFAQIFPRTSEGPAAMVVIPITLGKRTVCLLVGQPDGPASPQLREGLARLTDAAAVALARLLAERKADTARSLPRVEVDQPAVSAPALDGLKPQPSDGADAPLVAPAPGNGVEHGAVDQEVTAAALPAPPPLPARAKATKRRAESAGSEAADARSEPGESADESDPSASFLDRRTSVRLPHVIEVTHTSDHNFFVGFTEDVSEGGLFVATYAPLELGELLELSFCVPGLEEAQNVQCRVRWAREYNPLNPDVIPGVGVSFLDLSEDAAKAIHTFIRQRDTIFYED